MVIQSPIKLSKLTLILLFIIIIVFLNSGCSTALNKDNIQVSLTLNPYQNAPLSASADIQLPNKKTYDVIVSVLDKSANNTNKTGITISHIFSNKQEEFSLPILGLYPDYQNQIQFEFVHQGKNELVIQTPLTTKSLPTNIIIPIEIYNNRLPKKGFEAAQIYLVDNTKIAFDQYGEIRWAFTEDSFLNYGKLNNGNLLITSSEDLRFDYHYPKFYEVSMLGEIIFTYDISYYYGHHDIVEITTGENKGNLLVAVNEKAPSTNTNAGNDGIFEEDLILLMERGTGKILHIWDTKKLFDQADTQIHRMPQTPTEHPDDWIHLNALYYDNTDHSILFSSRAQSAVVKFDFETGELVWIITDNQGQQWQDHKNDYGQRIADYILKPITKINGKEKPIKDPVAINFWVYGQHAVKRVRGNGNPKYENILLYDNGNYRNYFAKKRKVGQPYKNYPRYSRAIEYQIDRNAMTISRAWEFDAGKKYFTIATGSVDMLANGNRLIGFMWTTKNKETPRIFELSPTDELLFEARFNKGKTFYYQIEKFHLYQGIK